MKKIKNITDKNERKSLSKQTLIRKNNMVLLCFKPRKQDRLKTCLNIAVDPSQMS